MADEEIFLGIQKLIDENRFELDELQIYRHCDSFDFVPNNINKKNGISYLAKLLNIECSEMIAVGDGVNDIPMFEAADISIGVIGEPAMDDQGNLLENQIEKYIDYGFTSIGEVLDFILDKYL